MTAATVPTMRDFGGLIPSKGNLPIAANTLILRKTIVYVDSAGRADDTATVGNAYGVASSTYDNRTTAPSGGAADAMIADVEFGVFEFAYTGTDPIAGKSVMFGVDNNTVSTDSAGGTLGIAGYCTEVNTTTKRCFVHMGPSVVSQIIIAASVAADVTTAQAAIDALEVDAATANAYVPIPLTSFVDADCDPLAKFVSEANPTFGFNLADSEAMNLRWNNHATPGTATTQVALPFDLDDTKTMTVELLCSKSGATLADATVITVGAYIIAAGDLHDADANCGGDTNALVGDATAKTTAVLTRTIAAADIQPNVRSLTLTLTPKAGTLGTDDLLVHSVRLHYTRKVQTA